uniref:Aldehyde dehydrogenase domain-containing protein n=1 Tax=Brassica oleracea var. oleracea TaxID=109376 RepID=A0A0D3AYE2_BRAOL
MAKERESHRDASRVESCNEMKEHSWKGRQNEIIKSWSRPRAIEVSIVMEQMMRLLHYCGLPVEDVDFINSDGKTMNKILLEGRIRLEDAGFDWKVLGPDVQEVDYVAWVCDQDAYACSGQKCSAQSMLFMHENWAKTSLVSKLKDLAGRRKLEDLTIGPVLTDIWDSFFGQGGFNQPYGFAGVIRWMHHSTPPGKLRTICKLIAQAVFYAIWNERNKRLHTSVARPPQLITKEIKIILKWNLLLGQDQWSSLLVSVFRQDLLV